MNFERVDTPTELSKLPVCRLSGWMWRFMRRNPVGFVAFEILAIFVFIAVFAPLITPHDPAMLFKGYRLADPGTVAPDGVRLLLGADELGRDLLARLILGARISLIVSASAVFVGITVGSIIGMICGYRGGKLDLIVQRVMDGQMAIPTLVLALVLMVVLGFDKGLYSVILAIGIILVPRTNRVVRSTVLAAKENVYVHAAMALGAQPMRIMHRHILPNIMAPILILISVELGSAVLIESSLSFLGFGVPVESPTWGRMLNYSGRQWMMQEPRLLLAPAIALSVTILAFNLAGDTLRDLWDPKLRGSV